MLRSSIFLRKMYFTPCMRIPFAWRFVGSLKPATRFLTSSGDTYSSVPSSMRSSPLDGRCHPYLETGGSSPCTVTGGAEDGRLVNLVGADEAVEVSHSIPFPCRLDSTPQLWLSFPSLRPSSFGGWTTYLESTYAAGGGGMFSFYSTLFQEGSALLTLPRHFGLSVYA